MPARKASSKTDSSGTAPAKPAARRSRVPDLPDAGVFLQERPGYDPVASLVDLDTALTAVMRGTHGMGNITRHYAAAHRINIAKALLGEVSKRPDLAGRDPLDGRELGLGGEQSYDLAEGEE